MPQNKRPKVSLSKLLSQQILLAMLAGLLIALPITLIPTWFLAKSSIENKLTELQQTSYDEVDKHLATGWQPHNVDKILTNLRQEVPAAQFYLLKHRLFLDEGESNPKLPTDELNQLVRDVERSKEIEYQTDWGNAQLMAAYPIQFQNNCLPCHAAEVEAGIVYPGLQAGTIVFQAPVPLSWISAISQGLFFILFIGSFIAAMFWLTQRFIHRRLIAPMENLAQRVSNLKLDASHQEVDWERVPHSISEVDRIDETLTQQIHYIQGVYNKLEALVVTEHETGLFHKDRFNEVINYEVMRSRRYEHSFSVLLLKTVSATPADSEAYQALDKHEQQAARAHAFSQVLIHQTRATDLVFRVGDQLYAIIAPETDAAGAQLVLSNIKERIQILRTSGETCEQGDLAFSFEYLGGYATFDEDGQNAKQLLHEAVHRMNQSAEESEDDTPE